MKLEVDYASKMLRVGNRSVACSIGRSGAIAGDDKREGDGATPLGDYAIRGVLLRSDRVRAPETALPWRWIGPQDGWSDDPADPEYNRPVRHPHGYSAERLWREDGLYDVIVVLGHNDSPPMAPLGSAIFLHCWREGAPTEGCVAIPREDLLALLPELGPGDTIAIR